MAGLQGAQALVAKLQQVQAQLANRPKRPASALDYFASDLVAVRPSLSWGAV